MDETKTELMLTSIIVILGLAEFFSLVWLYSILVSNV